MGQVAIDGEPGRELTALVASAPGKLILMGEHAVVYGEPALVAAVDLRLRARFASPGERARGGAGPEAPVEVRLPRLGQEVRLPWSGVIAYAAEARARWERFAEAPGAASFSRLRGEDPAHLVKVALGEAAARLAEPGGPALELEVTSELPIGSGFGSSAALAAAVAGGYLAWRGRPTARAELESLALEVERRQHGTPSGVDGAAVLRGGLVWAERGAAGGLEFHGLTAPHEHLRRFRAFDTGVPAEPTGAVVAAVRDRVDAEPDRLGGELRAMGRTTRRFRDALLGGPGSDEVVAAVRRFERGLETLGVVPGPVRRLVRAVEERGGAAKVSGAGALSAAPSGPPGAGSLLVYHVEPERTDDWGFLARLPRWWLGLGAEGFRLEEAERR